jgi:hypothetical protein
MKMRSWTAILIGAAVVMTGAVTSSKVADEWFVLSEQAI